VEQSFSADRWAIWDKANDRFYQTHRGIPRTFTRKSSAVNSLRRHIRNHNWRYNYDVSRGLKNNEWVQPFRQLSEEDDYEVLPCVVVYTIERT